MTVKSQAWLLPEEQGASYAFAAGVGGALKFHLGGHEEGQQAATAGSLGL